MHLIEKGTGVLSSCSSLWLSRLLPCDNHQSTIRGYLATIKFSLELYVQHRVGVYDVPFYYHSNREKHRHIPRGAEKKPQVRLPLMWSFCSQGYPTAMG